MFRKILVAVDRSDLNRLVFDRSLALAKSLAAPLVLLNVLSPEEEESPNMPVLIGQDFYSGGLDRSVVEIYQELWQEYANRSLTILRSLAEEATAAGISTEVMQRLGSPGRIICDVAQELDVDLIILGRRGRSGLNELFLGSVSNYVMHHAPCSVLTIHRQTQAAGDQAPTPDVTTVSPQQD